MITEDAVPTKNATVDGSDQKLSKNRPKSSLKSGERAKRKREEERERELCKAHENYKKNAIAAYLRFNKRYEDAQIQDIINDHSLEYHRHELPEHSQVLKVIFYFKKNSNIKARVQIQVGGYIDLNDIHASLNYTNLTMDDVAIINTLVLKYFIDVLHNDRNKFGTHLPSGIGFSVNSSPSFITSLSFLELDASVSNTKEISLSKFLK